MRNPCNIIQDLLPLYLDGLASEDSIAFVDEHLEGCPSCRACLERMKAPDALAAAVSAVPDADAAPLKAFSKKWSRKKRAVTLTLAAVLLIVLLLASCFLSYLKFDTTNPFSAAMGFLQITVAGKDHVQIQRSPRVILAQPGDAALASYMESRGYWELEEARLGKLRAFTNGEETEWVMSSQNRYFSKWVWE